MSEQENPYIKKPVLLMDGGESHVIRCRKHPRYSPRVKAPTCQWCLALFFAVKAR